MILKEQMKRYTEFLKNNLNKRNRIFVLVLLVIVAGILICIPYSKKDEYKNIKQKEDTLAKTIVLPIKYFSKDLIRGGTYEATDSNGDTIYILARVDEGYRSFPTTTITFDNYVLDGSYYYNFISKEDVKEMISYYTKQTWFDSLKTGQVKKYGDIAKITLPTFAITSVKEFDVDSDNLNEKIVSICTMGGNHCPHHIFILKEGKIVFWVNNSPSYINIEKSNSNNGFYVNWTNEKLTTNGYCCPTGYIRTRFVYDDGKFKPVYEQEVLYVKVEDPAYIKETN